MLPFDKQNLVPHTANEELEKITSSQFIERNHKGHIRKLKDVPRC